MGLFSWLKRDPGNESEAPEKKRRAPKRVKPAAEIAADAELKSAKAKLLKEERLNVEAERQQAQEDEWRLKDPDGWQEAMRRKHGVTLGAGAAPAPSLKAQIKEAQELLRLIGGGAAKSDGVAGIVDGLANSRLGEQAGAALGQFLGPAVAEAQRRQITPAPTQSSQPQPQQEATVPQPHPPGPNQAAIDQIVDVVVSLVDKPGQRLIPPAEAADHLRQLASLNSTILRLASVEDVRKALGRNLLPEQRVMLQEIVQGLVSDLMQEDPTPAALTAWIVDHNNRRSPHLHKLWAWFAADESTRVPWLVEVTRHLQGGAVAPAGPVEGI